MKNWPVAISILVSSLSAITILGIPGEIYTYGNQFSVVIFSYVLVYAAVCTVYIPMFRRIKITSVNEVSCIVLHHPLRFFYMALELHTIRHTNNTATITLITRKRFSVIFQKEKKDR